MLLGAVLSHTSESHPDYQDLVTSLEKVKAANDTINERKRMAENTQKLMDIQNALVIPPILSMVP